MKHQKLKGIVIRYEIVFCRRTMLTQRVRFHFSCMQEEEVTDLVRRTVQPEYAYSPDWNSGTVQPEFSRLQKADGAERFLTPQ